MFTWVKAGADRLIEIASPLYRNPKQTTISAKSKKQPIPRSWWRECTVYQVYPASFKDSNGDGLGDIPGIISELDYVQNLGVDVLWSSPLLNSPQVDMGYDISDYKDIYPPYGTMADHDALIKGLHSRGMRYVLDLVVNHTSSEHYWFKQSRSSKDNPYRDWYYWRPARYDSEGKRMPPNNWKAAFEGSVWEWDETTQEYYLHLFAPQQPDLNWENPKVVEAVHDVIRFWLERGVDGFRMDVINHISKTPGLPDASIKIPGFLQPAIEHYSAGPRLHEFLQGIGSILREYKAFSVGEMPGVSDPQEVIKSVGQDRGELEMIFNFDIPALDHQAGSKFEPKEFDVVEFKKVVNKWQTFMLENAGWNALFLENHDQGRTVSRYASDSPVYRIKSAKMLAATLALQSGTVFVYQGEELAQVAIPPDWPMTKYKDIEAVNFWTEEVLANYPNDTEKQHMYKEQIRITGRDSARTPMQWSSAKFAGFMPESTPESVHTWMDIHEDYPRWNAAEAVRDADSAFNFWKQLLQLRKDYKDVFVYGDFEMLDKEHESVVAYVRTADEGSTADSKKRALIVANWSGDAGKGGKDGFWYEISSGYEEFFTGGAALKELRNYDTANETKKEGDRLWIRLRPWEVIVAVA